MRMRKVKKEDTHNDVVDAIEENVQQTKFTVFPWDNVQ